MKMKFTKPAAEASKKTKVSLSDKSKFKSKDASAPAVKLQKNTKQAANLIKKMIADKEVNPVFKNDNNGTIGKKSKKKKANKPGELSPEVQMGLKLDKLIEQKIREQNMNASTSSKGKNAKSLNEMQSSSSSPSESSPKANKKRKKGKNKENNENKLTEPIVNQSKIGGDSPEKPLPNKKQGKKKRNENVVPTSPGIVTSESTDEPSKVTATKPKKKKGKAKQQSVADKTEQSQKQEEGDRSDEPYTLNSKDVLNAVKSGIDLFKKKSKSSKKLLDSEAEPVFLNFRFFHPHNKQRIIRFELCSPLVTDTSEICLFAPDISKKGPDDSKAQWEQILRDEKVTNISEVIPLKTLTSDYIQYQDKRKLSEMFDFFLVDGKISHRVYGLLGGKNFHSKRKTPTPVAMKKGKIAENIRKCLLKTVAQYTPAADSFTIQVGHTGMDEQSVMKNILKVWEQYPQQFGVYWENIEKASVFIPQTPMLPIFISVSPPKGKPREYKNMKWSKSSADPVEGELSTAMDKPVIVYPDGRVLVKNVPLERSAEAKAARREKNKEKKKQLKKKQNKSKDSDEEVEEEELDSDDDLGGRADMLESETDEESESEDEEPPKKKAAGKQDKKKMAIPQKKGKGKQTVTTESDEDSDSDIADEAEATYLRDLAAEKKAKILAQMKGKADKQQKSTTEDSDSDDDSDDSHPEDDEIDDSLDELEDLSMEEDSESDDEEIMKKPVGKPFKGMKKPITKGNKKMNGTHQQTSPKPRRQMTQKKSGAVKSSPNKKSKKKQDLSQPSSSPGTSQKKKSSAASFQGTQATQKQKKNKNQLGQGIKNKQMAKKLAK